MVMNRNNSAIFYWRGGGQGKQSDEKQNEASAKCFTVGASTSRPPGAVELVFFSAEDLPLLNLQPPARPPHCALVTAVQSQINHLPSQVLTCCLLVNV